MNLADQFYMGEWFTLRGKAGEGQGSLESILAQYNFLKLFDELGAWPLLFSNGFKSLFISYRYLLSLPLSFW
ncbi:hypothetical protein IMPR6_480002 [Imperialibacter sp. EC-SDR9]|nr:hypothetical protein IMPERIA89_420002 [Imperialibacter sp. 89]CAD5295081.1 hypothetical protein IMPERIA75_690002 [Imperialibacter sp. 75]VVT29037.1 hypothetical protein IMPR6_480002 [Imperialibacter sp. EC-SDR9]